MNYYVLSFSGGKNSTALLLMILERRLPLHEIIFCDTGMEFPGMYKHIRQVSNYIGYSITVLRGRHSFIHYFISHKLRSGFKGYGFPDMWNRWYTTLLKIQPTQRYLKMKKNVIEYQGIAVDEKHRILKNKNSPHTVIYPLVTWRITEAEALQYCYNKGFTWSGLYQDFKRVSCWCCPLARIQELRILYNKYPRLWKKLVWLDKNSFREIKDFTTVPKLEQRFFKENMKLYENN